MSSWWSVIHGHSRPVSLQAVRDQLDSLPHVMFGGLSHERAVRLARRLVTMTPRGLECVFFADSGSVAVEVALKVAMQAWAGQGHPQRLRFLTIRGGYHGDTFGATGICDPGAGMHRVFRDVVTQHVFADTPPSGSDAPLDERWASAVEVLAVEHVRHLAAIVVEPIVQGAGRMRFYSPASLRFLRSLCDQHDLLLICDEVATGFGRTGAMFASELAGVHCAASRRQAAWTAAFMADAMRRTSSSSVIYGGIG